MTTIRKTALAVALLLIGTTGSAVAQTSSQSNIAVSVTASGTPVAVTAYTLVTSCTNLQGGGASSASNAFPVTGGAANQIFSVTTNTACKFKITSNGSAPTGSVTITIGGTQRIAASLGTGVETDFIPVAASTTVVVNIVFPSFTVKKVVVGDEPVIGFDYPITATCSYNNGIVYGKINFTLKSGASKTLTVLDIPELNAATTCQVVETNSNGATSVSVTAVPAASSTGAFAPNGTVVTVTNGFTGELIVSKVVIGDPKSNIAVYEINVACSNGLNESFLLKDRQSWVKTGISSGVFCQVTETRSDGATVSYSDNSGDNATDGRVTIKGTVTGCIDVRLAGTPDCRSNVIVTNSYTVATTTAATTTAQITVAATTPPVLGAPVENPAVLDVSEQTVG